MKFRSAYSYGHGRSCPSGSKFKDTYMRSVGEDRKLIKTGTENVYDSIQKAAEGHTLDDLIRRSQCGDPSAIPRVDMEGFYDVSRQPTDLLEAHQMLVNAKNQFYAMPPDARAQFGNSFETFLSEVNAGTVIDSLSKVEKKATPAATNDAAVVEQIKKLIGGSNA